MVRFSACPHIAEYKLTKIGMGRWPLLMAVVMAVLLLPACRSHKDATVAPERPGATAIHVPRADRQQQRIVDEARTWLGTPYAYARADKGRGTDCSGMVMRVYEDVAGHKLPRNSAKQAEFCERLEPEQVAVGDLVFFATGKDADRVSHVGIVIDDTRFIHASASRGVVISDMTTPYYRRTFKMFGRVPELLSHSAE